MKPDELFEMLTDIDDKFIDDAMPESKNTDVVQPQKIQMTKRRFPWGIATAACLAVCVAVGAVVAVNAGKSKIPFEPDSPAQSTPLTTMVKDAEEIYTGTETLPLEFIVEEANLKFEISENKYLSLINWGAASMDEWYSSGVFPSGVTIRSVCLCDLNSSLKGDNYRELVAAVTDENGDKFIRAYDFIAQKEYEFKVEDYESRWHYDSLTLKDGRLYLCTEVEAHVDEQPLTLDAMKEVTTESSEQIESVYDVSTAKDSIPSTFNMPEFPDYEFTIDESFVSLKTSENDTQSLIRFAPISKVWLADLNGDSKREVISMGWNGLSGLAATYLRVYDVAIGKQYVLDSSQYNHGFGDFDLTIKDDSVYFEYRHYDKSSEDYIVETKLLTLDVMYEVDENYNPEIEIVLDETTQHNFFTMPEYPDFEFAFVDGDIEVHNNQTDTIMKLLDTVEIRKVYLYDDYRTHKRTIYTLAKRTGEQNTVVCLTYLNRDGKFVTSYIEPLEKGYDMDLTIGEYGGPLFSDSSPIDEGFSESVENDDVKLTVYSTDAIISKKQLVGVWAELTNKTNTTIYLYSPVLADRPEAFIHINMSYNGNDMEQNDRDWVWINEKVNYYPVSPGQTVKMDAEFNPTNAETGTYDGTCSVVVAKTPNDNYPTKEISATFQMTVKET